MAQFNETGWICSSCGKVVPLVYSFCPSCGSKRAGGAIWTCSNCGKPIHYGGYEYCIYCGTKKSAKEKLIAPAAAETKEASKPTLPKLPKVFAAKPSQPESSVVGYLCPTGYKLLGKIGSGGFSDVFKAEDSTRRIVALKFPKIGVSTTVSTDSFKKFLKEAEVWSKLKHKNIVKVYDYGTKPLPWLAMELMEGGSLDDKVKKGSLEVRDALKIAVEIADAICYAHRYGVVHQDIKPKNVLFDNQGNPKITDWGLAKVLLEESTISEFFEGTIICAAPEQLDPERYGPVDWRCDIYGFGVTLYWMLTGKPPFYAESVHECIEKIMSENPKPPSETNKALSKEIDDVLVKLLAKNKENRYEDMILVKKDLEKMLAKL